MWCYLFREGLERGSDGIATAKAGRLEPAHDVLKGGGHQEVLLLQSQLLTLEKLAEQYKSVIEKYKLRVKLSTVNHGRSLQNPVL